MIFNSNPASKLEAFCGSAVTTDVKFTVFYANMPPQSTADINKQLGTPIHTVSNGVSTVQIAPYPGQNSISTAITAGANNIVQAISGVKAHNTNASAVTVTIQLNDGTADIQFKAAIPAAGTGYYENGAGWYVLDSSGALVTAFGPDGAFRNLTVSGNTTLGDAAADSLTINAGVFSAPNLPAFSASSAGATNQTGDNTNATVTFGTEIFDQGSNFASSTFTAPSVGKFQLSAYVYMTGLDGSVTRETLSIVTSNRTYTVFDGVINRDGSNNACIGGAILADMDAADTAIVQIQVAGTTKTVGYLVTDTRFMGIQEA